jgi:hypothetical protein
MLVYLLSVEKECLQVTSIEIIDIKIHVNEFMKRKSSVSLTLILKWKPGQIISIPILPHL